MTKGERIKSLREGIGMSQTDLADKLDTKKQTIYKYETGIVTNIPSDKIEMMAKIFNVSPAYIMGWSNDKNPKTPSNIFPVDASRFYNVPIIGRVAAGLNCFADTNTVGYQPTDAAVLTGSEPYVYLRVVGDSMYPKFEEGDLVLVRCQSSVDSEPLMAVIAHDGSRAVVSLLDEGCEHHILLANALNAYDIDKYFRIIFDDEGCDWTFVCPPDYKGITNKEKRISQFFSDGVDAITEFLKAVGYDVPINIPKRYRRHMDYLKNTDL